MKFTVHGQTTEKLFPFSRDTQACQPSFTAERTSENIQSESLKFKFAETE